MNKINWAENNWCFSIRSSGYFVTVLNVTDKLLMDILTNFHRLNFHKVYKC